MCNSPRHPPNCRPPTAIPPAATTTIGISETGAPYHQRSGGWTSAVHVSIVYKMDLAGRSLVAYWDNGSNDGPEEQLASASAGIRCGGRRANPTAVIETEFVWLGAGGSDDNRIHATGSDATFSSASSTVGTCYRIKAPDQPYREAAKS